MHYQRLQHLLRARTLIDMELAKLRPPTPADGISNSSEPGPVNRPAERVWSGPARPNPPTCPFGRGELIALALSTLRQAGEPMRIIDITRQVLAAKGTIPNDRRLQGRTRRNLGQIFRGLDRQGITMRVGSGPTTKRTLATSVAADTSEPRGS
jgi:hypothetical protein